MPFSSLTASMTAALFPLKRRQMTPKRELPASAPTTPLMVLTAAATTIGSWPLKEGKREKERESEVGKNSHRLQPASLSLSLVSFSSPAASVCVHALWLT